jgi:DNA-binding beta-propeller fold protein YncE/mono/diheme cytochrome c family protein
MKSNSSFPSIFPTDQLIFVLLAFFCSSSALADGPGVPNFSYSSSELFKPLCVFNATNGAPNGHDTVAMHKGYLAIIFSRDGGVGDGGFSFYDISNPRSPRLVSMKRNSDTYDVSEARGYGFAFLGDYVALPATNGIQIWDWSDVTSPVLLNYLRLPGITPSDYSFGTWSVFWQAPYLYVGGTGNGLYIVDAKDPRHPVLADRGSGRPNPIPISQTGGFRVGAVFAVGNLLVATIPQGPGLATFDISDPLNPVLLKAQTTGLARIYNTMVNGDKILAAGTLPPKFYAYDISDPTQFRLINSSADVVGGRGGYLTFQDGFAHVGMSVKYAKIDMRHDAGYPIVGTASSGILNRDEDFATVLGNLVFIGSDHAVGSVLVPHQTAPDTLGPKVNMVNPKAGAIHQALTTRIGLTFTDQIDPRSINHNTFIVRPVGGSSLSGQYSSQTGIVNFSPDQQLRPNTVYEVVVPAGGLRDYVGNPTSTAYVSRFSTGATTHTVSCEMNLSQPAEVGENVIFSVKSATGNGPLRYSWEFGDGSAPTPFSATSTGSHTYTRAGHYGVTLSVMDSYSRDSSSSIQTIHYPLTTTQPTSSSTIILDRSRNRVWAVNPDQDTVTAIDAARLTKLFERTVGKNPRTLAVAPDGKIWVVNQGNATISVLLPDTGSLKQTIKLPYASQPYGVAFSPNGSAGYVTLQGLGLLMRLNPSTGALQASQGVGPSPRGIAISGDSDRLFATRFISPPDQGQITELSASSLNVARSFSLAKDPGPDTEASGRGVPNYISSLTLSPDGRRLWIPSKKDNTGRGLFRDGKRLTFENTVRTIVSQIDLIRNQEDLSGRLDLNDRDMAVAVQFSPLGDYAFIATQGTNTIEVFDAYSGQFLVALEDVGLAPQGIAFDSDGQRLFVQNFMSRTVAVYDVAGLLTSQGATTRRLKVISTVSNEKLSAQVLKGKQIFYNAHDSRMNQDSYISCASCHLGGGQDGRVWDFTDRGEGLRNTISLLGHRGTGQGRVHWTANFDEIQDFENDIRSFFAGSGFMTDAQFHTGTRSNPLGAPKAGLSPELDALAAFVSSLDRVSPSPYRNPDGSLTAGGQAGKALFRSLNCASCHAGNDFTDSRLGVLHDVGTLKPSSGKRIGGPLTGLDTPTLKGLWETAPYLHDGSAATLQQVLTTGNPNGRHGNMTQLNAQQRQQLVEYLLQIDESEIN